MSAQVQARPWLDHLARAIGRYNRQRGDYYAAGITYFTVLSMVPLLMLAFSVAGYVLARHPETLTNAHDWVVEHVKGSLGAQLGDMINKAVDSRTGVGLFGLAFAVYAGLGWMSNLRAALTEQWEQKRHERPWWRTKLSDLEALLGLIALLIASLGLTAVSTRDMGMRVLRGIDLDTASWAPLALKLISIAAALLISWLLFTWVIARLPREPLTIVSTFRAGLLAAVVFEVFKQVASIYLAATLRHPTGVVFGPVIGLMVFAYFTYRIILFATAWAATAAENMALAAADPAPGVPAPAVIVPRVYIHAPTAAQAGRLVGAGAVLAALAIRLLRRPRSRSRD
ncbi:MAG: inner membrane protein YhjD [Mycobacteriaceae bacterium]|nr:inner membrane protein YhjD [Mycobacteriaceae bacterium]